MADNNSVDDCAGFSPISEVEQQRLEGLTFQSYPETNGVQTPYLKLDVINDDTAQVSVITESDRSGCLAIFPKGYLFSKPETVAFYMKRVILAGMMQTEQVYDHPVNPGDVIGLVGVSELWKDALLRFP